MNVSVHLHSLLKLIATAPPQISPCVDIAQNVQIKHSPIRPINRQGNPFIF